MTFQFAQPMNVADTTGCYFYHSMDVPGFGLQPGGWDLRQCAHQYLGNIDFKGKRALDMGAASGFLTFEMEKRGASVVSYDLNAGGDWDIVPHYRLRGQFKKMRADLDKSADAYKRAYWLAHRVLNSKAQAFYGDVYHLPNELGEFDVSFFGMIFPHLQDPFQALYQGARLSKDAVVITGSFSKTERAEMTFRPSADDTSTFSIKGWWVLSIGCLRNMLGVLGFKIIDVVEFKAECLHPSAKGWHPLQAVVARRF